MQARLRILHEPVEGLLEDLGHWQIVCAEGRQREGIADSVGYGYPVALKYGNRFLVLLDDPALYRSVGETKRHTLPDPGWCVGWRLDLDDQFRGAAQIVIRIDSVEPLSLHR